jgi:hypothetical protein
MQCDILKPKYLKLDTYSIVLLPITILHLMWFFPWNAMVFVSLCTVQHISALTSPHHTNRKAPKTKYPEVPIEKCYKGQNLFSFTANKEINSHVILKRTVSIL